MNQPALRASFAPPRSRAAGFTLIEVMITVAIIGILAAIALPAYFTYIKRSRIIEATTALGDIRSQMEKYYMDNRTYVGAAGACGVTPSAPDPITAFNGGSKNFTDHLSGSGSGLRALTATTYSLRPPGRARCSGSFHGRQPEQQDHRAGGGDRLDCPAPTTVGTTRPDGSCD